MFKGLKSKLEDEAKKLQATVTQYGENLAQQVRSGASDAGGSDVSNYAKRLFTSSTTNSPQHAEKNQHTSGPVLDDSLVSLDDDNQNEHSNSAIMQGLDESDLIGSSGERVRRLSACSIDSNESSLSAFFNLPASSSVAQRLETISSDVESTAESTLEPSSFEAVSKDQLSTVFNKLQGRAINYKNKYRDLVKVYNEVVRENEKCRTVLAQTQDKALQRIEKLRTEKRTLIDRLSTMDEDHKKEIDQLKRNDQEAKIKKLQELLEKCKENITANKEKMNNLTAENDELRSKLNNAHDDQGMNDLAVERVTAEWKGRVDRLEEEWAQRMAGVEERSAIAIATSKAETHAALQQKDQEIEKWINKCHALEKKDSDSHGKWQDKLDELSKTIYALECEKADMVEKLSRAKQEGVKLVKEEEEKRRKDLEDGNLKLEEEKKALEEAKEKLEVELKKRDDEWRRKLAGYEEQMQLAIEEREMQKSAAVSEQDRRNDEISVLVEQLNTEKLQLQAQLEEIKDRSKRQVNELTLSIEKNSERHKQELASLMKEHEDLLEGIRSDLGKENRELSKRLEQTEGDLSTLRQEHENLKKKYTEMNEDLENEERSAVSLKRSQEDELSRLQSTINELNLTNASLKNRLKESEEHVKEYKNRLESLLEQHVTLQEQHSKIESQLAIEQQNYSDEISELKSSLETMSERLKQAEAEKDELMVEMQKVQELSIMNEQLNQQLEQTRREQREAEEKFENVEKRAALTEQMLQEDQKMLENVKEEISKTETTPLENPFSDVHQEEIAKLQEEIDRLKSELENNQTLSEANTQKLTKEYEESRVLVESLENQLEEKNTNEADLRQQIVSLTSQLEKAQADFEITHGKLQSIESEYAKVSSETNSKESELSNEIRNLQEKIGKLQAHLDQLENELNEKSNKNESQQSQILDLEEKIQHYLSQAEQLNEQRSLFENQYNALKNSYSVLEDKLSAVETQNVGQIRNLTDQLSSQTAQIELLESQLRELHEEKATVLQEAETIKIEKSSLQQKLNDSAGSNTASQQQLESLQETNEKMRLAFLEKEKIVSDLQKKMEQAAAENRILCDEVSKLNSELALIKEKSAHQRTSLDAEQQRITALHEKLEKQKKEIYDLNETLVVERGKKAELEADIAKQKQSLGEKVFEIQQLHDQIHNINSMSTSKDIELENVKQNEAGLQQKLSQFQEMEQALDQSRHDNMELSQKIAHLEIQESSLLKQVEELNLKLNSSNNEIGQLTIFKNQLEEKEQLVQNLQETKQRLEANAEELNTKVNELTNKLEDVEKERLVEIKRTQAKAEADRQKTVKNLQNEVRQLYQDLTKTTSELDSAKETIKKLEAQIEGQYDEKKRPVRNSTSIDDNLQEAVDQEELVSLRERVYQYQSEILELRDRLSREINLQGNPTGGRISPKNGFAGALDVRNMTRHSNQPGSSSSSYCENPSFAEPTEAEYLRNVLYRYMSERETLGKEIVTLAKVIATVAKFSPKQLDEVVHKEQERHQRWFEDAAKLKQYGAPVATCVANKRRMEYDRM